MLNLTRKHNNPKFVPNNSKKQSKTQTQPNCQLWRYNEDILNHKNSEHLSLTNPTLGDSRY